MTAATRHATRAGAHPAPVEDEPLVAPIDVDAASDYDVLPYPSMPITHTQPAHLAALAALFGAAAPAVERARVLELGCAAAATSFHSLRGFPMPALPVSTFPSVTSRTGARGLPH